MGHFPARSCSGNYSIVIAYHVYTNVILVKPFQPQHDHHRLVAADHILSRLHNNGHNADLQILYNEYSASYKHQIEEKWKANFQLIPPDMYRCNASEHTIQTFKYHYLSILAGVSSTFPNFLWDKLLQ